MIREEVCKESSSNQIQSRSLVWYGLKYYFDAETDQSAVYKVWYRL